jgi:hypothetical protein
MSNILLPIGIILLVIGSIAYILKRDSAIDGGAKPWVVNIPKTNITLTPSRWFWGKVRDNKAAVAGFIVVSVIALWAWLK